MINVEGRDHVSSAFNHLPSPHPRAWDMVAACQTFVENLTERKRDGTVKAMASSSSHSFNTYFTSYHVPDTAGSRGEGQACEMPPVSHRVYMQLPWLDAEWEGEGTGDASGWLPRASS